MNDFRKLWKKILTTQHGLNPDYSKGRGAGIRGAEVLGQMLLEYKAEVTFGVPGDTNLPLYEAIYDAAPKIQHVMARDELSAGFMADAYACIASKPGICEWPSGADALYSLPGLAEANSSSIPVILFTSDISLTDEGRGAITSLDHHKLFEPITKCSSFLKQQDKIPETLRRVFRVATIGRPGAAHLAFPQEILTGEYPPDRQTTFAEPECLDYPAYPTRSSPKVLKEAVRYLLKAIRPVIIAGGGTNHSEAGPEMIALSLIPCPGFMYPWTVPPPSALAFTSSAQARRLHLLHPLRCSGGLGHEAAGFALGNGPASCSKKHGYWRSLHGRHENG